MLTTLLSRSPGLRKALVVTSHRGAERQSTLFVHHQLQVAGLRPFRFAPRAVAGEPSSSSADEGAQLLRRVGADIIVALGGSAVLDLGKAMAHLTSRPLVAVPTVPCGGAETRSHARLFDWDANAVIDLDNVKPRHVVHDDALSTMDAVDWPTVASTTAFTVFHAALCANANPQWGASPEVRNWVNAATRALSSKNKAEALAAGMALSRDLGLQPWSETLHEALASAVASRVPLARSLVFNTLFEPCLEMRVQTDAAAEERMAVFFGARLWRPVVRSLSVVGGVPEAGLEGLGVGRQDLITTAPGHDALSVRDEYEECAALTLARYRGHERLPSEQRLVDVLAFQRRNVAPPSLYNKHNV